MKPLFLSAITLAVLISFSSSVTLAQPPSNLTQIETQMRALAESAEQQYDAAEALKDIHVDSAEDWKDQLVELIEDNAGSNCGSILPPVEDIEEMYQNMLDAFADPSALTTIGNGLFLEADNMPQPLGLTRLGKYSGSKDAWQYAEMIASSNANIAEAADDAFLDLLISTTAYLGMCQGQ